MCFDFLKIIEMFYKLKTT